MKFDVTADMIAIMSPEPRRAKKIYRHRSSVVRRFAAAANFRRVKDRQFV
jgi:ABC-type taurine transport system ATPase subunit